MFSSVVSLATFFWTKLMCSFSHPKLHYRLGAWKVLRLAFAPSVISILYGEMPWKSDGDILDCSRLQNFLLIDFDNMKSSYLLVIDDGWLKQGELTVLEAEVNKICWY